METEFATVKQKLKSVDQIARLQVDREREEKEKIQIQLENETEKLEELQEANSQLTMELSQIKIKLQYAEDKAEKESGNLRDKQTQVENLIKDYE